MDFLKNNNKADTWKEKNRDTDRFYYGGRTQRKKKGKRNGEEDWRKRENRGTKKKRPEKRERRKHRKRLSSSGMFLFCWFSSYIHTIHLHCIKKKKHTNDSYGIYSSMNI